MFALVLNQNRIPLETANFSYRVTTLKLPLK